MIKPHRLELMDLLICPIKQALRIFSVHSIISSKKKNKKNFFSTRTVLVLEYYWVYCGKLLCSPGVQG